MLPDLLIDVGLVLGEQLPDEGEGFVDELSVGLGNDGPVLQSRANTHLHSKLSVKYLTPRLVVGLHPESDQVRGISNSVHDGDIRVVNLVDPPQFLDKEG